MKEVRKISFNSLYEYITCPFKMAFSDKDKRYTVAELYNYAGRESLKTLFSFIALNRSWSRAYSEATEKFNYIWLSNIDKITEKFNSNVKFLQSYIITKAKKIVDFKSDEIVSVNFPLEYALNSSTILTDNIDLLVINSPSLTSKKTYRAINFFSRMPFENKRYFNLRAGFFRLTIQSYLSRSHYRDFSYELAPLNGSDEIYAPSPHFLPTIRTLVKNVAEGINNKVYYPTNNEQTCEGCPYKKTCSMSLINSL